MSEKPRVGVFICHCAGNISDKVNVNQVKVIRDSLERVKVADTFEFLCSNRGQEMIKKAINGSHKNAKGEIEIGI